VAEPEAKLREGPVNDTLSDTHFLYGMRDWLPGVPSMVV
jgi:hypothetical protein